MPNPHRFNYKHRRRTYPTPAFVFGTHDAILEEFPGEPGVKNEGEILSALEAPVRHFGGSDLYPTFFWKVAALGYFIASNHGFNDANKRTALLTVEATLAWNAEHPRWSQETKTLIFQLVGGGFLDKEGLRFSLLAACGYDIDNYNDLAHL